MTRKALFSILCTLAVIIAIIAMVNITPEESPAPQTTGTDSASAAAPSPSPSGYEIKLTGEKLCLYTLDEYGGELDRKTLEYIDIYSIRSSQLEELRAGTRFDSREAAAAFIQDLDS